MRTMAAAVLALVVGFALGVSYAEHPWFETAAVRHERAKRQLQMMNQAFDDIVNADVDEPKPAAKKTPSRSGR